MRKQQEEKGIFCKAHLQGRWRRFNSEKSPIGNLILSAKARGVKGFFKILSKKEQNNIIGYKEIYVD